jgi:hypothetical protein
MGVHGSVAFLSVQPNLGTDCETATLGEGDTQVQMIILDEAFVQLVREAVAGLDLSGASYYNYVSHVVVSLLERLDEAVSLPNVREALNYLAEAGELTLPAFAGV